MDGLTAVLTEKIDLTLMQDVRNDYLPCARYDNDRFKQDQTNDKYRDQYMLLSSEIGKLKGTMRE